MTRLSLTKLVFRVCLMGAVFAGLLGCLLQSTDGNVIVTFSQANASRPRSAPRSCSWSCPAAPPTIYQAATRPTALFTAIP